MKAMLCTAPRVTSYGEFTSPVNLEDEFDPITSFCLSATVSYKAGGTMVLLITALSVVGAAVVGD